MAACIAFADSIDTNREQRMTPESQHSPTLKNGLDRRTLVKGAAWSVPVIAAAVSAPLATASGAVANQELDFFLTAGQVIGQDGVTGSVQSNGVRISPHDPRNPKVVPAGTVITITIVYAGSLPDFSFLNTPYGADWMKAQNQAWPSIEVSRNTITLTATTQFDSTEPTIGSISWMLDPKVRPENDSIVFSGTAVIPPGGDYPQGDRLGGLTVDPNQGTGSISGPTSTSWPSA